MALEIMSVKEMTLDWTDSVLFEHCLARLV